jgi:hypothetical protein
MELRFNNEPQAGALHSQVADLCRTVIGEAIEACLKKHNISGAVLVVKKIDIDLGTIAYRDLETELPERLYHYLDRELARIIFAADTATMEITAPGIATLEAVRHFLQHGYLPWSVAYRDVEEMVSECLNTHARDFALMIRRSGQSSIVRHRVTQRFGKHTIVGTVRALEPENITSITNFHDHLVVMNTHLSLVKTSRNALERTLWLFILNTLLLEQGSVFNTISFAKSVLHQFACRFNMAYDEVIRLLRNGVLQWKGSLPMPYDCLIRQLVEMEPVKKNPAKKKAMAINEASAGALAHWLVTTHSRSPVPAEFGFDSYTEALQFTVVHHTTALRKQLTGRDHRRSWTFFQKLNKTELDHMATADRHYGNTWYSALLQEWSYRLRGFYKQQELLTDLTRVLLWSFHLGLGPSDRRFLDKTRVILNRYTLPASFNSTDRAWLLPVKGDIKDALEKIEHELTEKTQPAPGRKRIPKAKVKNETVQAEAEYIEKRTQPLAKTDPGDPVFIANAGLVLLHPYFSYLFDHLGLLKHGKFRNDEAVVKGIMLLHYAGSGVEKFREEDCVLNKVLCGHPMNKALQDVMLTTDEKAFADSMLDAFKNHWAVIDGNSHDAVRGNWLVREGKILETEKHWELFVSRKPYDLLMASLPFTLSPVCFSWMNKLMIIHWL